MVQFRDSLTDPNKIIRKRIKENIEIYKYFWLKNGNYVVKETNNSKPVRIYSIKQLDDMIDSKKVELTRSN